mmetsp:Transcript_707/g.1070  ORF Transcript_707/g.1070 Transcript_707/m.1070 type:complete len:101 (-) Transcript_707:274-576(-)
MGSPRLTNEDVGFKKKNGFEGVLFDNSFACSAKLRPIQIIFLLCCQKRLNCDIFGGAICLFVFSVFQFFVEMSFIHSFFIQQQIAIVVCTLDTLFDWFDY